MSAGIFAGVIATQEFALGLSQLGTDGSNPSPSSAESANHRLPSSRPAQGISRPVAVGRYGIVRNSRHGARMRPGANRRISSARANELPQPFRTNFRSFSARDSAPAPTLRMDHTGL